MHGNADTTAGVSITMHERGAAGGSGKPVKPRRHKWSLLVAAAAQRRDLIMSARTVRLASRRAITTLTQFILFLCSLITNITCCRKHLMLWEHEIKVSVASL
jgi:hypothetical protein